MSVGAMRSCNKQQQATMTKPIAMDAIAVITDRDGHNQRLHREAAKCSRDKPLKRDEEGRGNQPQSHKAVLLANATKLL